MSHIHSPHQCAPISRKITSTITLFCFYAMTLAQSVAATNSENDTLNDLHQKHTSFQPLRVNDTISSVDPISTPTNQNHFVKPSAKLLRFLVGFLCLSTLVQKASPSNLNLHSLSISSDDDVCQWGWNADMFTGAYYYTGHSVSSAGDVNGDGQG